MENEGRVGRMLKEGVGVVYMFRPDALRCPVDQPDGCLPG